MGGWPPNRRAHDRADPANPWIGTATRTEAPITGDSWPAIAIAYLSEEIEPRHAARTAGTYVAGTSIGGLLGRLVAGPVAELANWRVGVFTVAVLCAIAAALFIALIPAPQGFVPRGSRRPGIDASLYTLLKANLRSRRMLALYAQGFLLMGGFVLQPVVLRGLEPVRLARRRVLRCVGLGGNGRHGHRACSTVGAAGPAPA